MTPQKSDGQGGARLSTPLSDVLRGCGGLLHGHFLLSSGRHSDTYIQMARPFESPSTGAALAGALAARIALRGLAPVTVVGPALGAIVPGYALARALGARFLFAERGEDGAMGLRRDFAVASGEPVLVCENTLTTGGSALEVVRLLRAAGASVVGVGVYCDRIPDAAAVFGALPYVALERIELPSWDPQDCPLCARDAPPPVKPGSRRRI